MDQASAALARVDPWLVDGHEVAQLLDSDPAIGLSSAEVVERLACWGPNALDAAAKLPAWKKLGAQFADPLVYLLLVAIVVSAVAWALEGAEGVPFEAIVIAVIVLANGVLGYVQQRHAEGAVAALQRMAAATAGVLRDGREVRVPTASVVPGDILVLAEGDAVSADARLLEAAALTVAEASLTGESEPVQKDATALGRSAPLADRLNMVFSGTAVTRGRARAVVTETGMRTEMGHIAALLGSTVEERTPLQRELDVVSRMLGIGVVIIAAVVVVTVLLTSPIRGASDLVDVLVIGVSLAVAAVPESLQTVLTVVLALGVQRMARQRAIVKKLSSVETLGSASVVCADKTGTLTKNEMTVERVVTRSGEVAISGAGHRPDGEVTVDGGRLADGPLRDEVVVVLSGGSLANDASLHEDDGIWTIQGDPTEAAFLVAERKLGTAEGRMARFKRIGEVPFTSERKLMSTIQSDSARDSRVAIVTKGAPGVLLARCTRERVGRTSEELTEARRTEILAEVDRLAGAALRTLAVAYRVLESPDLPTAVEELEHDLVFAGVVGIIDPPRPEAAVAIARAQAAGLRVIMITGDHPRTAARIAADLGIASPGSDHTKIALSGLEIDALDEEAFAAAVQSVSVYARVSPEHKLRLIDALQADGRIVAMTGDGVNDAPALKAADIGVAMGITGTDVTKEAAAMILVDDNFATIVAAVREGRGIFANIQKFLRYLLSSNLGEVLTMFLGVIGASVIGLDTGAELVVPLLATQILWINLLTDAAPALALGIDPPPSDVMSDPPRRPSDRIIDREMKFGIIFVGLVTAVATLFIIDLKLPGGLIEGSSNIVEARTAGFTVLVLAQLFNCLNSRSERRSAFRGLFTNAWLWGAIALSLVLQVLVVHAHFLNKAFETTPLTARDWALCAAVASSVLWLTELKKLVGRRLAAVRDTPLGVPAN